jgi:undecaprenyl-phosphate 4-deoxy-4-formamido-L-arabinose transferase
MAVTLGLEHARKISAFRAFRRRLADPLRDLSDAFVSIDVCLSWSTVRVIAVPVAMSKRDQGSSNYRFSDLSSHALDMVTGYSTRPLRVMSVVGLAMSVVGFVLFGYVIYLFISGATEVAGFTTLASMIALFAGVQLLGLGIMGEYLGRLHFRSMRRPTFVVREQTGEVTGGGFEPPNLS